jgi:hypothetical protein
MVTVFFFFSSARAIAAAPGLPCLAQEIPGLALGIIAVESSLPATFLYQRKHRVDRWCCDLDEAAHFLDGGAHGQVRGDAGIR